MSSNRVFASPLIPTLAAAVVAGLAGFSQAGVAYSTTVISTGSTFPAGAVVSNPASLAVTGLSETNQQQAELIQTFVPTSTFTLGQISILSGGKGGGSVTLHLYPINLPGATGQGGGNADGFVNTAFAIDQLGGGAGLTVTVNGAPSDQIVNFVFSGLDQVPLTAGVEYGFEVDSTAGSFSWMRDAGGSFSSGNIYQAASGTTKTQVGGSPDRDGYFAIYAAATPEPASLALLGLGGMATLARRRRA